MLASQQATSPIGFLSLKLPPPPCAVLAGNSTNKNNNNDSRHFKVRSQLSEGVGKNVAVDRVLELLRAEREYVQLHRDTTASRWHTFAQGSKQPED